VGLDEPQSPDSAGGRVRKGDGVIVVGIAEKGDRELRGHDREASQVSGSGDTATADMAATTVYVLGPDPSEPGAGGMARVIGNLLSALPADVSVTQLVTMDVAQRFWSIEKVPRVVRQLIIGRAPGRVVHAHVGPAGSIVREGGLVVLASALGFRTIATVHASRLEDDLDSGLRRRLLSAVLSSVDVVHVLGARSRELVSSLVPAGAEVRVIPNGVPSVAEVPMPDQFRVLFLGEIGWRKGVDVLLEAWPLVRAAHPGARLRLVGPVHASGQEIAASFKRQENVEVLPPVEPADVQEHIFWSSTCVLPSRAEAFPMALLEAMAAGRTVVATAVGDVPDLVGDAGVLLSSLSAHQLAETLIELGQRSPEERRRRGAAARARVAARFSLDAVAGTLADEYRRLAQSVF